ncbi:DUF4349 domain-containing protein [Streptomyces sp. NPDC048305]|uniref:DUF4349 domain-containing protein n=1 Tax=Streptomyces sp. NPDC048305 TaxID=3365532 RepID=UPI0037144DB0
MRFDRHTDRHPPARPRRGRKLHAATRLLLVLLATGGCAASSDSGTGADSKAAAPAAQGAGGRSAEKAADGSAPKPGTTVAVHVIRTATLSVEVRSVPKAVAAARTVAESAGGLVAEEDTERVDDTRDMSRLVLRVPTDRYEEVLRELAGSGKLLSRTSNAKDVTGQVVDVESRIATQRASVARVRDLMDRAGKLSDVVTLEGELSRRQADLESLLAQQASLKDRTALATVTLQLGEPGEGDADRREDDPGFLDALGGGWDAFVTTLRWITVVIGATAPFLAAAALLVVVWRLSRGRRHRGTPDDAPEATQAPPVP